MPKCVLDAKHCQAEEACHQDQEDYYADNRDDEAGYGESTRSFEQADDGEYEPEYPKNPVEHGYPT